VSVVRGNSYWYRTQDGNFFWAGATDKPNPEATPQPEPVTLPAPPPPPLPATGPPRSRYPEY